MESRKVAVLVGSLRLQSWSRRLADALISLAPESLKLSIVPISLPLYNEDLEQDPPGAWLRFRSAIRESDGVLFVTPEYNRSVPAVIKNAIDVGSRPQGSSVWTGKPGAVVSVSPGAVGGFGANHHLRQSLTFVDVPVMQQPEAYIGQIRNVLGEDGSIRDGKSKAFFESVMTAFADWVDRLAPARAGAAR